MSIFLSVFLFLTDEEQFFNCLMQFKSRMDVNSPRSIRALTKVMLSSYEQQMTLIQAEKCIAVNVMCEH